MDLISRRINGERFMLLGWSRAILLQLAHPLVAAGVAEHGDFRDGSLKAAARLHHTVRAMLSLTFGDEAASTAALARIREIHRRVHGQLSAAAGIFPAGTAYSAEDPELVLWVHVTLIESVLLTYDRIVEPLTPGERDAYCAEAAGVAIELGARPAEVPRTWSALTRSLERTYESGAIAVSEPARELAEAVLAPPFALFVAPLAAMNRLVTAGLLPEPIRAQYGFGWSAARERRLERTWSVLRRCRRMLPRPLALWPEARRG